MNVKIIPASPANSATLAALHQACFDRGWSETEFNVFFERDGMVSFIAYAPCHPAGRVSDSAGSYADAAPDADASSQNDITNAAGFIFCWVVAGESELLAMGVLKPYRKQGVAHQLLTDACQRCADLGAAKMHLEVGVKNDAAQALYARHGFEITGRRAGYYHASDGTLEDALTMTKTCEIVTPVAKHTGVW